MLSTDRVEVEVFAWGRMGVPVRLLCDGGAGGLKRGEPVDLVLFKRAERKGEAACVDFATPFDVVAGGS